MTSYSPTVGGVGGTAYNFVCPSGAHITEFAGRSGSLIDRISAQCSDGTKSGLYGGNGGIAWTDTSATGFTGAAVLRGGRLVDRIQMKSAGMVFPARGGAGGTLVSWEGCPAGQKITSISGRSGSLVDQVKFGCSQVAAAVVAAIAPTPTPVLIPVVAPTTVVGTSASAPVPAVIAQPAPAVINHIMPTTPVAPPSGVVYPTSGTESSAPASYIPPATPSQLPMDHHITPSKSNESSGSMWLILIFMLVIACAVTMFVVRGSSYSGGYEDYNGGDFDPMEYDDFN